MKPVRLIPIGSVDKTLVDAAALALSRELRTTCRIGSETLDPTPAHHPERNQYHSTQLLDRLARLAPPGELVMGITSLDLYIPILTFVFGEAHLGGSAAVVSYHRLTQEFYGLPPDRPLLTQRLMKEAVHEAGHVLALTHCDDYECVMAASHSVEWLDLKGVGFCATCAESARLAPQHANRSLLGC